MTIPTDRTCCRVWALRALTALALASATLIASVGEPAAAIVADTSSNRGARSLLMPGESMSAGETLVSPNGRYRLTLRRDGNVIFHDSADITALVASTGLSGWAGNSGIADAVLPIALWDSRTAGTAATTLSMNLDGDLVLQGSAETPGEPIWHTRTSGRPGAIMSVRDDGTVAVGYPDGPVLWIAGTSTPDVGLTGVKHVVYGRSAQRIWLIDADGSLFDTYPVSGKSTSPAPGRHSVFSKSVKAWSLGGGSTMDHMVRFAKGSRGIAIGFHAIPRSHSGTPAQTVAELGHYRSAGCVRQQDGKAAQLYDWAPIGTPVVVLA